MDFTTLIKAAAPWIGTALGGPMGGMALTAAANALGFSDKTTASLKQALSGATPEQMLALKEADQNFALKMQEIGFKQVTDLAELDVRTTESVNKTMQAEAVAEHWPTYMWRPAIGFAVAFNLISASLVVFVAYLWKTELVAQIPAMLTAQAGLNAVALPILGISAYFRGKMQADPNIPTDNRG